MKELVGVVVVLGVVYLVSRFHERTYTPPPSPPPRADTGKSAQKAALPPKLPLRCAVVISGADRGRGTEIVTATGKALAVDNINVMRLLRPMGQMVADALPARAGEFFAQVETFDSDHLAADADVVLHPCCWAFGDEVGYDFKGLPMLIAAGSAWADVHLDLAVSGKDLQGFSVKDSSQKTVTNLPLVLFPYPRINRTMTEATESAVEVACRKVVWRAARDPSIVEAANRRSGVKVP